MQTKFVRSAGISLQLIQNITELKSSRASTSAGITLTC